MHVTGGTLQKHINFCRIRSVIVEVNDPNGPPQKSMILLIAISDSMILLIAISFIDCFL